MLKKKKEEEEKLLREEGGQKRRCIEDQRKDELMVEEEVKARGAKDQEAESRGGVESSEDEGVGGGWQLCQVRPPFI